MPINILMDLFISNWCSSKIFHSYRFYEYHKVEEKDINWRQGNDLRKLFTWSCIHEFGGERDIGFQDINGKIINT